MTELTYKYRHIKDAVMLLKIFLKIINSKIILNPTCMLLCWGRGVGSEMMINFLGVFRTYLHDLHATYFIAGMNNPVHQSGKMYPFDIIPR